MTISRHIYANVLLIGLLGQPLSLVQASDTNSYQAHADILAAASEFVRQDETSFSVQPQVSPGKLDSRLRLPRCDQSLQAYAPPNGLKGGRSVVGVRCDGEKPWKLFVPVTIKLPAKVVTAARPLKRGAILQARDLLSATKDLATLHRSYYLEGSSLLGQRLKRNLDRGDVVTPKSVAKDKLIKRGGDVTILASNPQFQVRMRGKAMANGARGDRIKVKNLSSGRLVSATVIDHGLVRVVH